MADKKAKKPEPKKPVVTVYRGRQRFAADQVPADIAQARTDSRSKLEAAAKKDK